MNSDADAWLLVRLLGKDPANGLPHTMEPLRPVDKAEEEQIKRDQVTVSEFGPSWEWNRILASRQSLLTLVENVDAATTKAHGVVNPNDTSKVSRAVHAVLETVSGWFGRLDAVVRYDDRSDARKLGELLTALNAPGTLTRFALSLGQAEDEPMVELRQIEKLGLTTVTPTFAAQQLAEPEQSDSPSFVLPFLERLIKQVQYVAACELLLRGPGFFDAAKRLRTLLAEVVYGEAAMMPADQFTKHNAESPTATWTQVRISTSGVEEVAHAIRVAEAIMRTVEHVESDPSVTPREVIDPKVQPLDPRQKPTATEDTVSTAARSTENASNSSTELADSAGAGPSAESPPSPIADIFGLAREVYSLSRAAEQEWSAAFDPKSGGFIEQVHARWGSILGILQADVANRSATLELTGHHSRIDQFPLSLENIAILEPEADDQVIITQLLIAELYAVASLARSMAGLTGPSIRVQNSTGKQGSWWDSGAFERVCNLSNAAIRVNQSIAHTLMATILAAQDPARPRRKVRLSWQDHAELADRALEHGLCEAAVLYANRAVSIALSAATARVEISAVKAQVYMRAIAVLERTNNSLSSGDPSLVRFVWPVAHFWVEELARWIGAGEVPRLPTDDDSTT